MENPIDLSTRLFDYLKGNLTELERVAMEREIEADENLKILIQQYYDKDRVKRELSMLNSFAPEAALKRVTQRKNKLRRTLLYSVSAASAAILVGVSLFMLYQPQQIEQTQQPELAMMDAVHVPTVIITNESNNVIASKIIDVKDNAGDYNATSSRINSVTQERSVTQVKVNYKTIIVPTGYTLKVNLPDGTIVMLDAKSELTFPDRFEGGLREVKFRGNAYFDVTKSAVPMHIKTPEADVMVYGTRFNLFSSDVLATTELVLEEGSVGVSAGGLEQKLVPNQRAICVSGSQTPIVDNVNPNDYTGWMSNVFRYHKTPLKRIIYDIYSWYGVKINIDERYANEAVFIEFNKSESVEWVVKTLEKLFETKIEKEGGEYYMR